MQGDKVRKTSRVFFQGKTVANVEMKWQLEEEILEVCFRISKCPREKTSRAGCGGAHRNPSSSGG